MNPREVEAKYAELRRLREAGRISEDEFRERVAKLGFKAEDGNFYQLDPNDGRWLMWNGTLWVPKNPPQHIDSTGVSKPAEPEPVSAWPQEFWPLLKLIAKNTYDNFFKQLPLVILFGVIGWVLHTYLLAAVNQGFTKQPGAILGFFLALQQNFISATVVWFVASAIFFALLRRIFRRKRPPGIGLRGLIALMVSYWKDARNQAIAVIAGGVGISFVTGALVNPRANLALAIGVGGAFVSRFGPIFALLIRSGWTSVFSVVKKDQVREFSMAAGYLGVAAASMGFILCSAVIQSSFLLGIALLVAAVIIAVLAEDGRKGEALPLLMLFGLGLGLNDLGLLWAHDGGLAEAGGTWSKWLLSQGAPTAFIMGIGPAIGSMLGPTLVNSLNSLFDFLPGAGRPEAAQPEPAKPTQPPDKDKEAEKTKEKDEQKPEKAKEDEMTKAEREELERKVKDEIDRREKYLFHHIGDLSPDQQKIIERQMERDPKGNETDQEYLNRLRKLTHITFTLGDSEQGQVARLESLENETIEKRLNAVKFVGQLAGTVAETAISPATHGAIIGAIFGAADKTDEGLGAMVKNAAAKGAITYAGGRLGAWGGEKAGAAGRVAAGAVQGGADAAHEGGDIVEGMKYGAAFAGGAELLGAGVKKWQGSGKPEAEVSPGSATRPSAEPEPQVGGGGHIEEPVPRPPRPEEPGGKPPAAEAGEPKPPKAEEPGGKPPAAEAGEPKPPKAEEPGGKPPATEPGEPKPPKAEEPGGKPPATEPGEPKPPKAEEPGGKPPATEPGEPKPPRAEEPGEPKPPRAEKPEGKPPATEPGEPKPPRAEEPGEPKPPRAEKPEGKPPATEPGEPTPPRPDKRGENLLKDELDLDSPKEEAPLKKVPEKPPLHWSEDEEADDFANMYNLLKKERERVANLDRPPADIEKVKHNLEKAEERLLNKWDEHNRRFREEHQQWVGHQKESLRDPSRDIGTDIMGERHPLFDCQKPGSRPSNEPLAPQLGPEWEAPCGKQTGLMAAQFGDNPIKDLDANPLIKKHFSEDLGLPADKVKGFLEELGCNPREVRNDISKAGERDLGKKLAGHFDANPDKPIFANVKWTRPDGTFSDGHAVLIRGVDAEGKIKIRDPILNQDCHVEPNRLIGDLNDDRLNKQLVTYRSPYDGQLSVSVQNRVPKGSLLIDWEHSYIVGKKE